MTAIRKFVPNLLTLINLFLGCMAIVEGMSDTPMNAAYFILLAAVFDFLDGFAARTLNAQSKAGIQLDSLADVVSFGVAPSVIFYQMLVMSLTYQSEQSTFATERSTIPENIIIFSAFLIALFSATRLARFNTGNNNKDYFEGLTTTANAMLVASLAIWFKNLENTAIQNIVLNPPVLILAILILCFLLVSKLRTISMKFENFSLSGNALRYIILIASALFIIIWGIPGIGLSILFYIIVSAGYHLFVKPVK